MKHYIRNKNLTQKLIAAIILYSFMLLLLTGCSNEKTEKLQKEMDQIVSEHEELQKNYDNLVEEYRDLSAEQEILQSELQVKQEENQTLQTAIDDLNTQIAALQPLQEQCSTLTAENESLKAQMASIQSAQTQNNTPASSNSGAQTASQTDNQGAMVWLSETGSKYHRINNCGRMNPNKARQVSQVSAESSGYGRCSKCF